MTELITLLSTQGVGLVVLGIVLFGVVVGVPKFFKWVGMQWEDLKDVFKNYISEQVETMKELAQSNRDLVSTVFSMNGKVDSIEDRVEIMSEDIKIIKEKVSK